MKTNFYAPINPIITHPSDPERDKLTELNIRVYYDKGDSCTWSGRQNQRGIYVSFTPIYRNGVCIGQTILGDKKTMGFKVFLKELNRRSDKQLEAIARAVESRIADFTREWDNDDWDKMWSIAKECVKA